MANATTRAHVVSPTAADSAIPVADPSSRQTSAAQQQAYEIANDPIEITTPQNRREKRKQKKQQKERHDSAAPTPANSDTESLRNPPNNPPKKKSKACAVDSIPPSVSMAPAQKAFPLLICSIGNPAPYANSLHSAGHFITSYLSERKHYQPFTKGLSGMVSRPDNSTLSFNLTGFRKVQGDAPPPEENWTFWQSTSLMNVSGVGVKKAYNEWLQDIKRTSGSPDTQGRLVIIHDELELDLGKAQTRESSASERGHNGLKSCKQQLPQLKYWRIGVGIGRPESREPRVVSKYVLSNVTNYQRAALEKSAVHVFATLEKIAAGQR